MTLATYRSCSFGEKRQVLDAFWRTGSPPAPRIAEAALEYGFYAVLCMAAIVIELAVIGAVMLARDSTWAWTAAAAEAVVVAAAWWSWHRYRALKARAGERGPSDVALG